MKIIAILCLAAFCGAAVVRADDACCEDKSSAIEQRLRAIDLSLALKQYEEIQTERAKAEVGLALLDSAVDASEEDRAKQSEILERRVKILTRHADEFRKRVLSLSKPIEVASK